LHCTGKLHRQEVLVLVQVLQLLNASGSSTLGQRQGQQHHQQHVCVYVGVWVGISSLGATS
jgi:hypothetical protein